MRQQSKEVGARGVFSCVWIPGIPHNFISMGGPCVQVPCAVLAASAPSRPAPPHSSERHPALNCRRSNPIGMSAAPHLTHNMMFLYVFPTEVQARKHWNIHFPPCTFGQ